MLELIPPPLKKNGAWYCQNEYSAKTLVEQKESETKSIFKAHIEC